MNIYWQEAERLLSFCFLQLLHPRLICTLVMHINTNVLGLFLVGYISLCNKWDLWNSPQENTPFGTIAMALISGEEILFVCFNCVVLQSNLQSCDCINKEKGRVRIRFKRCNQQWRYLQLILEMNLERHTVKKAFVNTELLRGEEATCRKSG